MLGVYIDFLLPRSNFATLFLSFQLNFIVSIQMWFHFELLFNSLPNTKNTKFVCSMNNEMLKPMSPMSFLAIIAVIHTYLAHRDERPSRSNDNGRCGNCFCCCRHLIHPPASLPDVCLSGTSHLAATIQEVCTSKLTLSSIKMCPSQANYATSINCVISPIKN